MNQSLIGSRHWLNGHQADFERLFNSLEVRATSDAHGQAITAYIKNCAANFYGIDPNSPNLLALVRTEIERSSVHVVE